MSSRVAATGVTSAPSPNGSVPIRREIRDLQANYKDQWNVYLLGLADLQKKDPNELLSYYQLAGIHGQPFVPWNGVNGNDKAAFGGYCTHSSILFLPWHRPYLATYEQALYASVQKVANKFPQAIRPRYVAAAKDFRMPYWDWALKIGGQTSAFPTAVSSSSITVIDVDGVSKPINNPLYSFVFSDKNIPPELALDDYWSQISNTKRSPDRSGRSQNGLVSQVITNESASLRNNVSLVLLSYKQFDAVSDNAWARNEKPGTYGSLEDVHNEIHDKVGNGGHMGSLEVSAFDPVFWLHHTNIDRLWAIWQALNPNSYVIDKVAQAREANFTIAANTKLTGVSDLKPFYTSSATNFWKASDVKNTTPFNYAYPETQRWLYPNDQSYQAAVRSSVTTQYGGNVINNFFENIAPRSIPVTTASVASAEPVLTMNFMKKAVAHPVQAAQEVLKLAKDSSANPTASNGTSKDHTNGQASNPVAPTQTPAQNLAQKPTPSPAVQVPPAASVNTQTPAQTLAQKPTSAPPLQAAPQPANASPQAPVQVQATSAAPPSQAQAGVHPPVALNVPKEFEHLVPNRTYTEYITNLRALKHGLQQTFRVYVFLGDFNPDPTTWPTEHNVVGRFTVLGRAGSTPCSKCQSDTADDLVVTGTVPLTSALLQDIVSSSSALRSLDPGEVVPYLERNLHWRVTVFDGTERPRDQVPGLKVAVVSTKVRIGDDGVPVYSGVYDEYPAITDGRPAGLGAGDVV